MNAVTKESIKTAPRVTSESNMPIDPDVKMPAAVMAAKKASDDMIAALKGDLTDEQPSEPAAEPEKPAEPASAEPVTLQEPVTPTGNSLGDPVETQPVQPPQAEADDWKHKYQSLHGRFTKQEASVRALQEEIGNLHNVIATLQATGRTQAPAEPAAKIELSSLVTEEEVNEYGKDLLDVVGRRAQEAMAPLLGAAQQEIAQLKAQLSGVNGFVAQDSKDKLLAALDGKLPQWRQMNSDPAFLDWLALPDPFSGAIRHDMLKEAYAQGHANRVLAFFNGYLAQEAAVAPAQGGPDTSTAQTGTPGAQQVQKVPLASLAAPGRAKAAAADPAPAGNEKPIISRAQIAAFYADVAAGKYRTRPEDKAKTEAMIFSATRDGRVR